MTLPLIHTRVKPLLPSRFNTTSLLNLPGRDSGLNVTVTLAVLPGRMGVLVYSAVVHPHHELTSLMTTGSMLVLVNVKVWLTLPSFSLMVPKSWTRLSYLKEEIYCGSFCAVAAIVSAAMKINTNNFFI